MIVAMFECGLWMWSDPNGCVWVCIVNVVRPKWICLVVDGGCGQTQMDMFEFGLWMWSDPNGMFECGLWIWSTPNLMCGCNCDCGQAWRLMCEYGLWMWPDLKAHIWLWMWLLGPDKVCMDVMVTEWEWEVWQRSRMLLTVIHFQNSPSRTSSIPSRSSNKAQKESAWLGQSRCNSSRDRFCWYWGSWAGTGPLKAWAILEFSQCSNNSSQLESTVIEDSNQAGESQEEARHTDVMHVINYDMPNEVEEYVRRIVWPGGMETLKGRQREAVKWSGSLTSATARIRHTKQQV